MTTQATTWLEGEERQGLPAQLVMTAVTLTIIAAFVLWQVRQGGGQDVSRAARHPTQSGATEGVAVAGGQADPLPRGGMAELYAERQAAVRTAAQTIYIVDSQERAEALRAALEEANVIRAASGLQPLAHQVLWFRSGDEEAHFWESVGMDLAVPGLVSRPVIDLRGRAAPVTEWVVPARLTTDSADTLAADALTGLAGVDHRAAATQARQLPPSRVVYLVDNAERRRALIDLGLGGGESVPVVTGD